VISIPTIRDRVVQGALRLLLEPIFEADFSRHSCGARPGRSAHDAIGEVRSGLIWKKHLVVDVDLKSFYTTSTFTVTAYFQQHKTVVKRSGPGRVEGDEASSDAPGEHADSLDIEKILAAMDEMQRAGGDDAHAVDTLLDALDRRLEEEERAANDVEKAPESTVQPKTPEQAKRDYEQSRKREQRARSRVVQFLQKRGLTDVGIQRLYDLGKVAAVAILLLIAYKAGRISGLSDDHVAHDTHATVDAGPLPKPPARPEEALAEAIAKRDALLADAQDAFVAEDWTRCMRDVDRAAILPVDTPGAATQLSYRCGAESAAAAKDGDACLGFVEAIGKLKAEAPPWLGELRSHCDEAKARSFRNAKEGPRGAPSARPKPKGSPADAAASH
jgi:Reverse transcriptase (RNA-dependent DNA polymerase)